MKLEVVPIDKLVFDPANARLHDDKNLEAIKGSLARFGQQKPIVVDKDMVVRAGNGTLQAAKMLGWKNIKVVKTNLTGSEATAYSLSDNRTGELSNWDFDVLGKTLQSLREEGFELPEIGFDTSYLDKLLEEPADVIKGSKELSEDDFKEFEHCCPKCGFEFD